ncbi:hypothetical protein [Virgibacillus doumboii]|uniref:hypothetical protein n=1 Tax=Virgibacillus doumboii TaxID=2697503 RepID=UPI0013DFF7E6|nr:hypothetical protein [Virgibacillus doumboii]
MNKCMLVILFLVVVGCSQQTPQNIPANPPSMFAIIDGEEYLMEAGGYQWKVKQGGTTRVTNADAASPNQIAEDFAPIALEKNSKVEFAAGNNPDLTAYLWNNTGRVKEIPLQNNQIQVPDKNGRYIYELRGNWPNGEASYTIVVKVE